jgi:outer membrane translocation and assembly module TamA
MLLPFRHVRSSNTVFASLLRANDEFTFAGGDLSRIKAAARAAWTFTSAKSFGYSISSEDGGTLGITAELAPTALGSSADATAITADGRLYLRSFAPHHVIAVRLAAGTSSGDAALGRTFHLGGAGPNLAALSFGRDAISLLRGFPADTFGGRHIALINADYRWPIARPQHGVGTWPFFLRTLHTAVFVDAGHTWNRSFRPEDMKAAVGAELSADTIVGYSFPVSATIGGAWGRDGSGSVAGGGILYFRIGRAF